jgi:hypothetical protein
LAGGRAAALAAVLCAAAALAWFLTAPPAAAEQASMTFRSVNFDSNDCGANCPQVVVADGVIEAETPQAFADFARQEAKAPRLPSVIFMNSPGGNVVASMELGAEFRKLRAAVVVAGYASVGTRSGPISGQCLSACVYALMGATRRVAPPESRVGLHRMFLGPTGGGDGLADRAFVGRLAKYAARMGVNPALVWRAESLPPGVLHALTPQEIVRWRLAAVR